MGVRRVGWSLDWVGDVDRWGVEMGATLVADGCAGLRGGIFLALLVKSDTLSSSSLAGQSLQCVKESPITHNILTESEFMFTGIYSFGPFT